MDQKSIYRGKADEYHRRNTEQFKILETVEGHLVEQVAAQIVRHVRRLMIVQGQDDMNDPHSKNRIVTESRHIRNLAGGIMVNLGMQDPPYSHIALQNQWRSIMSAVTERQFDTAFSTSPVSTILQPELNEILEFELNEQLGINPVTERNFLRVHEAQIEDLGPGNIDEMYNLYDEYCLDEEDTANLILSKEEPHNEQLYLKPVRARIRRGVFVSRPNERWHDHPSIKQQTRINMRNPLFRVKGLRDTKGNLLGYRSYWRVPPGLDTHSVYDGKQAYDDIHVQQMIDGTKKYLVYGETGAVRYDPDTRLDSRFLQAPQKIARFDTVCSRAPFAAQKLNLAAVSDMRELNPQLEEITIVLFLLKSLRVYYRRRKKDSWKSTNVIDDVRNSRSHRMYDEIFGFKPAFIDFRDMVTSNRVQSQTPFATRKALGRTARLVPAWLGMYANAEEVYQRALRNWLTVCAGFGRYDDVKGLTSN